MNKRLALGTVQFGLPYGIANQEGQVSVDEVRKILYTAQAAGIDTIDTAAAYGSSEQVLGESGIADYRIITKLPGLPDNCHNMEAWINKIVQNSLKRLEVNKLGGLLLHRPLQLLDEKAKNLYQAIINLKNDGLVEKIGYSIYSPADLDKLFERFPPDLVQAPLNVIDQQLLSSGWLKRMHKAEIEIHVRSIFLQGLLLMTPEELPVKFSPWKTLWDHWYKWLSKNKLTPVQGCLRFALAQPEIDRIVVGVDNNRQLNDIIAAAQCNEPLSPLEHTSNDENLINPSLWPNL